MRTRPLFGFIAALLLVSPGYGGTLTVNTTADHAVNACDNECTLRDAVSAAQANDTINFASTVTGTITLSSGEILLNKNLAITGPGARTLQVSGNNATRIFNVSSGSVAISGLALVNGSINISAGSAEAAAIRNTGALTLTNCSLTSNNVVHSAAAGFCQGGAIANYGTLVVRGCTFSFNSVQAHSAGGGAIYNGANSTLVLINSTISNNTLKVLGNSGRNAAGGGIFNQATQLGLPGGIVRLINCTIFGNTYQPSGDPTETFTGGGIDNHATCQLQNTIVANNSALTAPDVSGSYTSRGFDLITNTSGSSGWIVSDKTNVAIGNISGLVNNGGPTNTHMPGPGSPAVDGGSNALAADPGPNLLPGDGDDVPLTIDQRGNPRVVNATVDIGAVEFDPAQSAPNFVVTTNDEHDDGVCGIADCSLLEALNASNANPANNSVITFAASAYGTIKNTLNAGGLSITRPVKVSGPGADSVVISGASVSRIFSISATGKVEIDAVTIRDASAGSGDGGAVRSPGSGTSLMFTGCRFLNNKCVNTNSGSAIYSFGPLSLTNCEIGFNSGGGGAVKPRSSAAVTKITGCDFHDNESVGGGSGGYGGAMQVFEGPGVTIDNSIFRNNKAFVQGGAVYVVFGNSSVTLTNCTLSGNSANEGGAIYVSTGTSVTLNATTVVANTAGNGGGIYNAGSLTLTNATLSSNSAFGAATIGTGYGGAIFNDTGSLAATNVTFSGNSAFQGDHPELIRGGGIETSNGTVLLTNTVFAKGDHGANCSEHFGGTGNLSDDGTCGFTYDSFTRDNVNLLLAPLANNGGPTQTHLPQPQSPVVDHGTMNVGGPSTDQRGVHRPQGPAVDAGAVELAPFDKPRLANISTRLRVETGDNVLIGGFIVTGTDPKKVIVRAIGTSLPLADKLENPTLELYGPNGLIEANDNWIDSPNKQAIIDSTIAPASNLESAIVQTLAANGTGYTAIVRGAGGTTGIGVVEAYDLDAAANSILANISTRGFVQTGDNVLIAGTIVVGPTGTAQKVIIRGIGPSLPIAGKLQDPFLALYDANGTLLEQNDNWVDSPNKQAIIDSTIPPANNLESAIVRTLTPANYTAILRGVNDTTGIAVVEVYALN